MADALASQKQTSLFTNRNYLFLWTGQSLSLIGDYFFSATITFWMIDYLAAGESWLPLAAGGVVLALAIPSLFLSPVAGVFVDRWDRRLTMIWTDIIRMVLVIAFLFIALLVSDRTILIVSSFVTLFLIACGAQFFNPARIAVVADIVPQEQHPQAYGSLRQAHYFAQIVGPSLSAPLFAFLGPTWAISLNAVSFFVSFLILLWMRVPPYQKGESKKKMGFWQEFQEGLQFFVTSPILVALLISGMIFMFGGMVYNSFEYLYGVENLHIPDEWLGLYVASFGIGVVFGLPIAAALAKRFTEVEVLWLFLIGSGIVTLVLSRLTSMIPGMICGVLLGFFGSSISVAVRPLTVLVTPRELIGRVMAFEVPMITIASLAGGVIAGILASTVFNGFHATFAGMTFGRLDTIFVIVGIMMIGAGIYARLSLYPAVKQYRAKMAAEKEMPSPAP